ncbi:MAG: hypothetical protein KDC44_23385, partial [Phaeodactylibacter sp.]|nr:hypothetical protein [Phaeodactylibacter sp.]
TESIAFPFTRYLPLHPALEIGLTMKQVEQEKSVRQWNGYAGWYYHEKIENGVYLRAEYLYGQKLGSFLRVDAFGGLGYLHTFYPGTLLKIDPETGAIEKVPQYGRAHAIANVGIGLVYRNQSRWEPFVKQSLSVETPFANGIPVMVHSFLQLGVNLKF